MTMDKEKPLQDFEPVFPKRLFGLVAGVGFEPTTSGL
jgi:hypothetical protein